VSQNGSFSSSQKGFGSTDVKSLKDQVKISRRVALQIVERMDAAIHADETANRSKIGFFM
jgi:hypothetical protein